MMEISCRVPKIHWRKRLVILPQWDDDINLMYLNVREFQNARNSLWLKWQLYISGPQKKRNKTVLLDLMPPQNILPVIMLIRRLPGLFLASVDVGERVIESAYRQLRAVEVVGGEGLQVGRHVFRGELPGVG